MVKPKLCSPKAAKPYRLENTATGLVSKETFYTAKAAKHNKNPVTWVDPKQVE